MRKAGERVKGKGEGNAPRALPLSPFPFARSRSGGWTLIELVITLTVLTILTLGVIPLVRTSIRRQKEQRLHEALRQIRNAIDEFRRDTVGMQCGPGGTAIIGGTGGGGGGVGDQGGTGGTGGTGGRGGPGGYIDPRSRVVIADCKIFGVENFDKLPPDLKTLVDGVDVIPRATAAGVAGLAGRGLDSVGGQASDSVGAIPKKKRYLREIPIDPMTGNDEWCVLSSLDDADDGCSSSPVNVFDVRSKAQGEALNGEKYSDW